MNKQKPTVRDATTKDLGNMIGLSEQLIDFEDTLGGGKELIKDKAERRKGITEAIAEALVNPNYKILVLEKSGTIVGLFVAYIEYALKIFKRSVVCNIWLAFTKKPQINTRSVQREIFAWAKSRNCDSVKIHVADGNDRMKQLLEAIEYERTYTIYEKTLDGGKP